MSIWETIKGAIGFEEKPVMIEQNDGGMYMDPMESDILEEETRPAIFDDFVGNTGAAARLKKAIKVARLKEDRIANVIMYGNEGSGKTTLANIIATEMGCRLKTVTGASLKSPMDLFKLLMEIKICKQQHGKETILFIDEIHEIGSATLPETEFYPLFERYRFYHPSLMGKTFLFQGEKWRIETGNTHIDPFTIIGCTTDMSLHPALVRRFPIKLYIKPYTNEELSEIAMKYCEKKKVGITKDAADNLSLRSRNNPSTAISYIDSCLDELYLSGGGDLTEDIVNQQMSEEGVTVEGLRYEDIEVLKALKLYEHKGLGLMNLAGVSNVKKTTIQNAVEPFLKNKGYMKVLNKRFITEKGLEVLKDEDK